MDIYLLDRLSFGIYLILVDFCQLSKVVLFYIKVVFVLHEMCALMAGLNLGLKCVCGGEWECYLHVGNTAWNKTTTNDSTKASEQAKKKEKKKDINKYTV